MEAAQGDGYQNQLQRSSSPPPQTHRVNVKQKEAIENDAAVIISTCPY